MKTREQDQKLINLLKLNSINRIICDTDKGTLKLQILKGESNYHFLLDSVPLPTDLNKEVMELLFPIKIEPKVEETIKNKGGRPKGVKSK